MQLRVLMVIPSPSISPSPFDQFDTTNPRILPYPEVDATRALPDPPCSILMVAPLGWAALSL